MKKIKQLNRDINRIATKKGPRYKKRLLPLYRELLQKVAVLTQRARDLCLVTGQLLPEIAGQFRSNTLQALIVRTERVADTTRRRVILGETVANSDKLFSIFEPHTQLYKRGKAGQPMQFGRQILVFEDAAGFVVRAVLMKRDEGNKQVAVHETKSLQNDFQNGVKRLSFDRGFYSPDNQKELSELVDHLCLPRTGVKQSAVQLVQADDEFRSAQQIHSGVESVIRVLQNGKAMKRCRDCSAIGFEHYLQLGFLGRNLHTLSRMLIARENQTRQPLTDAKRPETVAIHTREQSQGRTYPRQCLIKSKSPPKSSERSQRSADINNLHDPLSTLYRVKLRTNPLLGHPLATVPQNYERKADTVPEWKTVPRV